MALIVGYVCSVLYQHDGINVISVPLY